MVFRSPEYNILVILLILYIILGIHAPFIINNNIHSIIVIVMLTLFVIYIAYNSDKYLTVLSIIASLLFIYRTHTRLFSFISGLTSSSSTRQYENPNIPTDTLEQDMVRIRIPNSNFLPSEEINLFTTTFVPIEDTSTLPKSDISQPTYWQTLTG